MIPHSAKRLSQTVQPQPTSTFMSNPVNAHPPMISNRSRNREPTEHCLHPLPLMHEHLRTSVSKSNLRGPSIPSFRNARQLLRALDVHRASHSSYLLELAAHGGTCYLRRKVISIGDPFLACSMTAAVHMQTTAEPETNLLDYNLTRLARLVQLRRVRMNPIRYVVIPAKGLSIFPVYAR